MKKFQHIAVAITLLGTGELFACTGIFLKTNNNTFVYARTMEFGQDMQSKIMFIPRNYSFTAMAPNQQLEGLTWQAKYAAVGANALGLSEFLDGVNEKGLAGGLFYFPGFAEYQEVTPEHYKQSLPMWQLLTWILTNFETVEEVQEALPTIYVSSAEFPAFKQTVPAHLIVHDTTGKSLVIEYLEGKLHTFENPFGIITNAPNFDWHMTNLRNYINLNAN